MTITFQPGVMPGKRLEAKLNGAVKMPLRNMHRTHYPRFGEGDNPFKTTTPKQHKGWDGTLKKFITFPAAVAAMLSFMPATGSDSRPLSAQAVGQVVSTQPVTAARQLTQSETERYQKLKEYWDYTESLDQTDGNRQAWVNYLEGQWNGLVRDAQGGNSGAREIVRRLVLDQNEKEITQPGLNLVRFNYPKFNTLQNQYRNGEIDRAKFNTEVQWRGLLGVYTHFAMNQSKGMPVNGERFYSAITRLMSENPNTEVQKWGTSALLASFGSLTPAHQNEVIDRVAKEFLHEPDGIKKQNAMWSLSQLRWSAPDSPVWNRVTTTVRQRVQDNRVPENEKRYDLMMLALLRDSELATLAEPLVSHKSGTEFQQALAWSMGRVQSAKGISILEKMAKGDQFASLAREMAVFSLGEYASTHGAQVRGIMNDLAQNESDRYVQHAAKAILDKMNDRASTESEFYVNLLIRSDAEKARYRQLRSQYVVGFDQLNLAQKNFVDKALLPYRHLLSNIINQGGRHWIVEGSITDTPTYYNLIGVRIQDGRLWDNVGGVSSTQGAVTSTYRITPGGANVFAHEFMHHIHQMILDRDATQSQQVRDLYQQAMREKRVLDYYAATNEYEYLAQGGEAHNSPYKNHVYIADLVFDRGYEDASSHTATQLMRQDPDMYNFIDNLADTAQRLLGKVTDRIPMRLMHHQGNRLPVRDIEPERAIDYTERR